MTCGTQATIWCAILKTIQLILKFIRLQIPLTSSLASNIQVIFQLSFSFPLLILFQGFAFNSVNDDAGPQRLKCHVEICHIDTENSPCSTGCYEEPTTTTTTTTTTTSTSTTTTTSTTSADRTVGDTNPNTHYLCGITWLDGWTDACSPQQCYPYVHEDDYFYNEDNYNSYTESFSCEFTVAIECDPNFVDIWGDSCGWYQRNGACEDYSNGEMLEYGYLTDVGFKTGLNCPQCGCGADGAINMHDRENLRSLIGGGDDKKTPKN